MAPSDPKSTSKLRSVQLYNRYAKVEVFKNSFLLLFSLNIRRLAFSPILNVNPNNAYLCTTEYSFVNLFHMEPAAKESDHTDMVTGEVSFKADQLHLF